MSAPDYFAALKKWIRRSLSNSKLFPQISGIEFSAEAKVIIETAYRRMFRVFAHLYTCHFAAIQKQNMEVVINTLLAHFVVFAINYELILEEELDMLEPVFRKIGEGPEEDEDVGESVCGKIGGEDDDDEEEEEEDADESS